MNGGIDETSYRRISVDICDRIGGNAMITKPILDELEA
jgi:hypothetical protein